jgi:hypothetical protein
MGNPAMVRAKKTEKRRKKFELRLGPGAYLPKEEREKLNKHIDEQTKAETARKADAKKQKDADKKAAAEKK